jgi:hypothetical protein
MKVLNMYYVCIELYCMMKTIAGKLKMIMKLYVLLLQIKNFVSHKL